MASIVVETRYNPDGFYLSPDMKFIVNIWQLGIWIESDSFGDAVNQAFGMMRDIRKQIEPYRDDPNALSHPWAHYVEYLRERGKDSPIEYAWVGKHRPDWLRWI